MMSHPCFSVLPIVTQWGGGQKCLSKMCGVVYVDTAVQIRACPLLSGLVWVSTSPKDLCRIPSVFALMTKETQIYPSLCFLFCVSACPLCNWRVGLKVGLQRDRIGRTKVLGVWERGHGRLTGHRLSTPIRFKSCCYLLSLTADLYLDKVHRETP